MAAADSTANDAALGYVMFEHQIDEISSKIAILDNRVSSVESNSQILGRHGDDLSTLKEESIELRNRVENLEVREKVLLSVIGVLAVVWGFKKLKIWA